MKIFISIVLLSICILLTGCSSKQIASNPAVNDPVQSNLAFTDYDADQNGVIDSKEFPKHVKNYDADIAGTALMVIITSVCILTFGLVMITCSRDKIKNIPK